MQLDVSGELGVERNVVDGEINLTRKEDEIVVGAASDATEQSLGISTVAALELEGLLHYSRENTRLKDRRESGECVQPIALVRQRNALNS